METGFDPGRRDGVLQQVPALFSLRAAPVVRRGHRPPRRGAGQDVVVVVIGRAARDAGRAGPLLAVALGVVAIVGAELLFVRCCPRLLLSGGPGSYIYSKGLKKTFR